MVLRLLLLLLAGLEHRALLVGRLRVAGKRQLLRAVRDESRRRAADVACAKECGLRFGTESVIMSGGCRDEACPTWGLDG